MREWTVKKQSNKSSIPVIHRSVDNYDLKTFIILSIKNKVEENGTGVACFFPVSPLMAMRKIRRREKVTQTLTWQRTWLFFITLQSSSYRKYFLITCGLRIPSTKGCIDKWCERASDTCASSPVLAYDTADQYLMLYGMVHLDERLTS